MQNKIFIEVQEEIDSPTWLSNVESFLHKVLEKLDYKNLEISLFFCNDEYIKELNSQYRKIDSATDVLSFENDSSYEEDGITWKVIGDIVISVQMISENAKYFETTEDDELKRLLVHGVLHLNGFDHGEEHIEKNVTPTCEMLVLQENILEQLKNEKIIY